MGNWKGTTPADAVRQMNREAGYRTDKAVMSVTKQAYITEGLYIEKV